MKNSPAPQESFFIIEIKNRNQLALKECYIIPERANAVRLYGSSKSLPYRETFDLFP